MHTQEINHDLRPNRLFDRLPLPLFAGAVPDLTTQTCTTAWTPDSAPATQTIVKAGNHKSPTNCYPCKEWED